MLEKLLGDTQEDYSLSLQVDNETHYCEVDLLNETIERLECQNALNLERLEEHAIKEESEEQEKDKEI